MEMSGRGWSYALKRTGFAIATIVTALTLNFVLFRVLPGNAATRLSRVPNASIAMKHALEVQFGLDKPLWQQYILYVRELAHGNLGVSFANRQPVLANLTEALGNTVPMVATGTLLALGMGAAVGVLAAVRRGTWADSVPTSVAVVLYALPTQFLGVMMVILFAHSLPSAGMHDPFLLDDSLWARLKDYGAHMILPVLTLALTLFAENTLIMRSAMLETLGEDYILTARAKGVPLWRIIWHHSLRNALLPIVTLFALSLGSIVTGSILVEVIFSWPGIGRALYEAVLQRDYPMLQGGFLAVAVVVTLCNLVADLLYVRLDPRVVA